ncbi:MAG: RNB domain-containing ribonuclease, partial [Flavitalea sp.]
MGRKDTKKKRKKSSDPDLVTGVLDITRSGMGYVIVDKESNDIMVRPNDLNTALHGDTVKVKISNQPNRSKRQQGYIAEVVKRKQVEFLGRLQMNKNFAFFVADVDKPMTDIYVPFENLNSATENDRVIVKIVEWEKNKKPLGQVVQILNPSDEGDFAMKEILMESGFPLFFPDNVIEEGARLPDIISQSEIALRKDFRETLTFTIDPLDAKDFDDAISFRVLKNGNYEVGVHIADVSHFVEIDSDLDKEAYQRATSVYLPDRVLPMLPERISNELCSLRPHEEKLTFSAVFQITPKAEVKEYWLGKSVIHSNHRFTY